MVGETLSGYKALDEQGRQMIHDLNLEAIRRQMAYIRTARGVLPEETFVGAAERTQAGIYRDAQHDIDDGLSVGGSGSEQEWADKQALEARYMQTNHPQHS